VSHGEFSTTLVVYSFLMSDPSLVGTHRRALHHGSAPKVLAGCEKSGMRPSGCTDAQLRPMAFLSYEALLLSPGRLAIPAVVPTTLIARLSCLLRLWWLSCHVRKDKCEGDVGEKDGRGKTTPICVGTRERRYGGI
jgi:hypothetical protein